MSDTEDQPAIATTKPTFVKRSRPRGAPTAASTSTRLQPRTQGEDDDDDDDAASGVVRRSSAAGPSSSSRAFRGGRGRPAGDTDSAPDRQRKDKPKKRAVGTVIGDEDMDEPAFEINTTAKAATSTLQETHHQTDTSSTSLYSLSDLAALKATTPSTRLRQDATSSSIILDEDGNPVSSIEGDADDDAENATHLAHAPAHTAYRTMTDPMTQGDSTLRFGADHLQGQEGQVPTASVIEAAKERRRRAAAGNAIDQDASDDFIPLDQRQQPTTRHLTRRGDDNSSSSTRRRTREPHPESTLAREEDEIGSGEDEYADFTGATDRIQLSESQRRRQESKLRRERAEMIRGESNDEDEQDSDDSGQEYERVQINRHFASLPGDERKRREKREKTPYRPAPIPDIIPLPSIQSTTSTLESRLTALKVSQQSHAAVVDSSTDTLAQLDKDKVDNQAQVEASADKDAWMSEFTGFIESLADLLESKYPLLHDISRDWTAFCARETRKVQQARAQRSQNELASLTRAPQPPLLPPLSPQDEDENGAFQLPPPSLSENGTVAAAQDPSHTDETNFESTRQTFSQRLDALLSDVKAPEYLSPDGRLPGSSATSTPHPSSITARFTEWRRRYPSDYNSAWGGLALSGIYEFWAWKEAAISDIRRCSLESSDILQALSMWSEQTQDNTLGGDEEVVGAIVNAVYIPRLLSFVERGAYDPWDEQQTKQAVKYVWEVADFADRSGVRFNSILGAFLTQFQNFINHLRTSIQLSMGHAPHPLQHTTAHLSTLLANLLRWLPLVQTNQTHTRTSVQCTGTLLDILNTVVRAHQQGQGQAREIVQGALQGLSLGSGSEIRAMVEGFLAAL